MFATVYVAAKNEKEARAIIDSDLSCIELNLGDDDLMLFQASIDGEHDLIEIDGHDV